jgi:hypothetical protein
MKLRPGQIERQMKKDCKAAEMEFMRKTACLTLWDHKKIRKLKKK